MKILSNDFAVTAEALGLCSIIVLLCLYGFIVLIYLMRRKIDYILRKLSPLYLGVIYALVIASWIGYDDAILAADTVMPIQTKLQTYQTLIVSIGAVSIAIIAYWGATATTRYQKEKEEHENTMYKKEYYPAEVIFDLSYFKYEIFNIIDKVKNDRFHYKNQSFYHKDFIEVNFDIYINKLESLYEKMSIEKTKYYNSFKLIQAFKYKVIILNAQATSLKKIQESSKQLNVDDEELEIQSKECFLTIYNCFKAFYDAIDTFMIYLEKDPIFSAYVNEFKSINRVYIEVFNPKTDVTQI